MSELILSNQLIIPRRSFIKGTGIAIATLFAGPAIATYSNLMDIDTKQNRLVVAFIYKYGINKEPYLSLLNAADILNPEAYKAWQEFCHYNEYSLMRRAKVKHDLLGNMTLQGKRQSLEDYLGIALRRYREKHGILQV